MKQTVAAPLQNETRRPIFASSQVHTAVHTVPQHAVANPAYAAGQQSGFGRDFSKMAVQASSSPVGRDYGSVICPVFPQRCPFGGACHTCPARVQAKLTIGQPGDKYEQEADRVADMVMQMPDPAVEQPGTAPGIQRACPACEDELRRQPEEEEEKEKPLQAKRAGDISRADHAPALVEEVLRSPGQPLDSATRAFMEPRFGYDFGQVHVHTDTNAADSARAVNALAYTVGSNVVFDLGKYAPETAVGRKLLAHELAHVTQQQGSVSRSPVQEASAGDQPSGSAVVRLRAPAQLQRLGANPTCTKAEADDIHQAVFDARGWLNKAIPKLEASPLSPAVTASLRRNFGPTYGVPANAELIRGRLATARAALGTMSIGCDTAGVTPLCIAQHCGWAVPGSRQSTICTNPPSTLGLAWPQAPGCVLHESLHASMSFMAVDRYKNTPGYPGAGTEPLRNADSYTSLAMDLS